MSRTTIVLYLLTTALTGCQYFDYAKYDVSLVAAKIGSMVPHGCRSPGPCGECCNCIPKRPWTQGYCDEKDYDLTQLTAQRCAFVSLKAYRARACRPISHHFKMGFIAAYEDLAFNRRPSPPIVPPPKYWNAYYRSCAGKPSVEDWFAGYDAGLEMGMNSGVAQFGEVYLRRGNQGVGPIVPANYDDGMMGNPVPLQPQFPPQGAYGSLNYR